MAIPNSVAPEDWQGQAAYWKKRAETCKEQLDFTMKCCEIFNTYLDKLYPGWSDGYADGIVDAILTHMPTLNRERAMVVVESWLIPTLQKIARENRPIGNP